MSRIDTIKFVLLTTQRSGSTFIRLWLNSHPNVRCHSEIFLRGCRSAECFTAYCEESKGRRLLDYIFGRSRFTKFSYNFVMKRIIDRFLDKLFNDPTFTAPWTDNTTDEGFYGYKPRTKLDQEKAVGFQIMYNQLNDYWHLRDWIANQNIAIIHLIRFNALKLLLSRLIALKTGEYHFAHYEKQKFFLDPQKILKQLDKIVNEQEDMRKKFPGNPYLEITYEQFFHNYPEESKRIFAFLKLENNETETPGFLKKMNPESLEELIENYDEIVTLLKGTPYQRFLD